MKPPDVTDFPELQRVFSGYLHQDFSQVHATPDAAVRAFLDDANPSERRRFVREVKRFLDRTSGLDDEALWALVARLGSRWAPPSRQALIAVLVNASRPPV
ncbi:MAG: contact-dependent growth inhibition system immunity protein [Vicinamibacterales bacterium]